MKTYFEFVELRHKVEIHNLTGRVVECPIDEMNRHRGRRAARLRIPPTVDQVGQVFAGWRGELATCRKFGPTARNYAAARLMSEVGPVTSPTPGKASPRWRRRSTGQMSTVGAGGSVGRPTRVGPYPR